MRSNKVNKASRASRATKMLEANDRRLEQLLMLERGMTKSDFNVDHGMIRSLIDKISTERHEILSGQVPV